MHQRWVEEVFDRAAAGYGGEGCSFFDYFGERLVQQAQLAKGAKMLDVATGKGALFFPAAHAVGATGQVIGIDISSQMLQELQKRGIPSWATVQQMDAEQLNFPDKSFDAVLCAFALFFFPHPHQALLEFKRVLKPQGQLALSTWGKWAELDAWVIAQARHLGATRKLKLLELDTAEALREQLETAGFTQIKLTEERKIFHHASPQAWWASLWTHSTRAQLEQLSPSNLAQLKQEALARAAVLPDLSEERCVLYGFARRP